MQSRHVPFVQTSLQQCLLLAKFHKASFGCPSRFAGTFAPIARLGRRPLDFSAKTLSALPFRQDKQAVWRLNSRRAEDVKRPISRSLYALHHRCSWDCCCGMGPGCRPTWSGIACPDMTCPGIGCPGVGCPCVDWLCPGDTPCGCGGRTATPSPARLINVRSPLSIRFHPRSVRPLPTRSRNASRRTDGCGKK